MTQQVRDNLQKAMRKAIRQGCDPYNSGQASGKWFALMEADRYRRSPEALDVAPF